MDLNGHFTPVSRSTTITALKKRDDVWLPARTPQIPDQESKRLRQRIGEMGYDLKPLRKMPQPTLEQRGAQAAPDLGTAWCKLPPASQASSEQQLGGIRGDRTTRPALAGTGRDWP